MILVQNYIAMNMIIKLPEKYYEFDQLSSVCSHIFLIETILLYFHFILL